MKVFRCFMALFTVALMGCSSVKQPLTVAQVPEADLYRVEQSQFDRFVVADPEALSQYNKVMLFAMQFDRLKISSGANAALFNSWMESDWKQMDYLCQQFDDLAKKIFSESRHLQPTNVGGEDVLAIEFRLVRFHPYEKPYHQADRGTVGTSSNFEGLGEIEIQAVLANAKTGELVGVIEDGIVLSGGAYGLSRRNIASQPDSNSRAAQNIAWRSAFRHWNTALHQEVVALKTQ